MAKAPSQWKSERDIIREGKQHGDVGIEKREDQLQAAMSIGASDFKQNIGKVLNKIGIMKDEGYDALKDSVNDQQHTALSEYETKYYPNSEWSQKDERYQKGVYSPDYQKQQPEWNMNCKNHSWKISSCDIFLCLFFRPINVHIMTNDLHKCLLSNKSTILWLFIGYYLLHNCVCVIFGFLFGYLLASLCILYFHDFFINVYKRFKFSQICLNIFVFFVVKCKFFPYNENKWIDVQNRKRKNNLDFDKQSSI